MATLLCERAGISTQHPCTLGDLAKFEDLLDKNICVIQAELGNKFVRRASRRDRTNLYLYLHDGHYDAIVSMTGFLTGLTFVRIVYNRIQKRMNIVVSHIARPARPITVGQREFP